jgi:NifB/MoaA-like Fe-S oxidoreductase
MAPLMEPLLHQLTEQSGAQFELIVAENSLFGPTITTAGLLVGRDILTALSNRTDLDYALIPAETINEDSVFLDDFTLEAVREALPMPIFPSYDFIDVLESQTPVAAV